MRSRPIRRLLYRIRSWLLVPIIIRDTQRLAKNICPVCKAQGQLEFEPNQPGELWSIWCCSCNELVGFQDPDKLEGHERIA